MPTRTNHTHARANLAALCDEVLSTREPIVIHRRGAEDVALVATAELRSLMETAHLLRSPANTQRLLTALRHAQGSDVPAKSVEVLWREFEPGPTLDTVGRGSSTRSKLLEPGSSRP